MDQSVPQIQKKDRRSDHVPKFGSAIRIGDIVTAIRHALVISRGSKRGGGLHKTPPWLPWQKSLLWMSLLFGGGGGGGGGDQADTMLVSPSRILVLGVTVTLVAFAGGGMAMDVSY